MKIKGLLFITLATLISCGFFGDKVDKEKIPGRYVFQIWGKDTLDVYSNGMYSYYRWWYGKRLQNSGTWTYDPNVGAVDFHNFSFLTDSISIADLTFLPYGHWITRVKIVDDEIRFVYASDIYKGYFLKVDSINTTSKIQMDTSVTEAQRNYEKSMIYREFDNDSLVLDLPDLKQIIKSFTSGQKVREKEYGAGDYFGKFRVYANKSDTLIVDKGDGGEYGFDNAQYLKKNDSIVLYRQYKFENTYWAKVDSITETVVKFKKGSMILTQRAMSSSALSKLYFGNIKFDTIHANATIKYKQLKERLAKLYKKVLIE